MGVIVLVSSQKDKGQFRLQMIILLKETRANPKTNTVLGRKCYHNRY